MMNTALAHNLALPVMKVAFAPNIFRKLGR